MFIIDGLEMFCISYMNQGVLNEIDYGKCLVTRVWDH